MRPSMQILPMAVTFAVADHTVIAHLSPLDRRDDLVPDTTTATIVGITDDTVTVRVEFVFKGIAPATSAQTVTVNTSWSLDTGFVVQSIV